MTETKRLRGIVFDLDGTLVDSRLDFDLMRAEIGIPKNTPILEFIDGFASHDEKLRALEILHRHEMRGAEIATVIDGVHTLLRKLDGLRLPRAIFTRNLRQPVDHTLQRLGLEGFGPVITRTDAPAKPDPAGLLLICRQWGCKPQEVILIGDYLYDIQAGQRAGMKTILYASDDPPYAKEADHVVTSMTALADDFERLARGALGFSF